MAIIPVKIDSSTVKLIDALVDLGIFRSRNDAIRSMIVNGLKTFYQRVFDEEIIEVAKKLLEIKEPIMIVSTKEAWEIVAEERDRF